eukprot:92277-Chlamydomonas_euryale.AAC.2
MDVWICGATVATAVGATPVFWSIQPCRSGGHDFTPGQANSAPAKNEDILHEGCPNLLELIWQVLFLDSVYFSHRVQALLPRELDALAARLLGTLGQRGAACCG